MISREITPRGTLHSYSEVVILDSFIIIIITFIIIIAFVFIIIIIIITITISSICILFTTLCYSYPKGYYAQLLSSRDWTLVFLGNNQDVF